MSSLLLERCADRPVRRLAPGDELVRQGHGAHEMFVLVDGQLEVVRDGTTIAAITDPGVVVGEIAFLLGTEPGATVRAVDDTTVHVVDDPVSFMADDPAVIAEIARVLARRLDRLSAYLADVKAQYADAGGNLGLLDTVLSELAFGEQAPVEAGSERDPDPRY